MERPPGLGPQFDRTYWDDPNEGTRFYGPRARMHNVALSKLYDPNGQVADGAEPLVQYAKGGVENLPHQGLLFHPATGTGSLADPLQPDHSPQIRSALGLDVEAEKYATRAYRHGMSMSAANAQSYESAKQGAERAIKRTGMTPEVLDRIHAYVTVDDRSGRSYARGHGVAIRRMGGRPDWSALTHELGHTREGDDRLSQNHSGWVKPREDGRYTMVPGRPDPRSEGIADGFDDRFARLASAQDTPEAVAKLHESTGYRTSFSGFKDRTGKALYAATRLHAATGDHNVGETPSREWLLTEAGLLSGPSFRDVETVEKRGRMTRTRTEYVDMDRSSAIADSSANRMLLGYLAHHNPAVMPHMEAQGFGKEAQAGLELYRQHFPHEVETPPDAGPQNEQLSLNLGKAGKPIKPKKRKA